MPVPVRVHLPGCIRYFFSVERAGPYRSWSMAKAMEFLQQLAGIPLPPGVHLLGPVPAPMERRAGRYRTQMLLQCSSRPPLHQAISLLLEQARTLPAARQCRWHLDVDPIDML